ncbi:hypothetical protein MANES_12G089438v8 [Manihot esculenta]|uniref:Uncharacterized protein n=1 Tax=Manihot esculenta TaxID=3983 RepID=A0ACB7GQG8_MANES|nr:hypothetical protein MANES_12G089438v8 [Manihot esculenta]
MDWFCHNQIVRSWINYACYRSTKYSYYFRGRGRSYRGRGGQSSYQGRGSRQSSYASGRGTSTLTCFNCNGTGHVSRQCPSPRTNPQANIAKTQTEPFQAWTVDSGANYHLAANQETIAHPIPVNDATALTIADSKTLPVLSRGSLITSINSHNFHLNDILYSPVITNNLMSVSAFTSQNNTSIEFFPDKYFVKDIPTKQVLYQGPSDNGLSKSHKLPFVDSLYCAKQPLELICSDV